MEEVVTRVGILQRRESGRQTLRSKWCKTSSGSRVLWTSSWSRRISLQESGDCSEISSKARETTGLSRILSLSKKGTMLLASRLRVPFWQKASLFIPDHVKFLIEENMTSVIKNI